MTQNHHKIGLASQKKPYLNNSIVFASKLNKSRSLLKNSVLRCVMKETNNELARTLAQRESEIGEMRKDHNRLLKENYDLLHTGNFRSFNFNSYMTKFAELTDVALMLFNGVCKLSDELLEMKNHPFLTGEGSTNESCNTTNQERVPSPFAIKDKIARSPLHSMEEDIVTNPDQIDYLASQVFKIKNQSNNSIHNLSAFIDGNASFAQKKINNKPDSSQPIESASPIKNDSPCNNNDVVPSKSKITIRRGLQTNGAIQKNKKMSQDVDPMFLIKGTKKTDKRKKKNLTLKTDVKVLNKEEYKKHKENDAYHLSINETLNTTILPTSLNEFKNQQNATEQNEPTNAIAPVKVVQKPVELEKIKESNQIEIVQNNEPVQILQNKEQVKIVKKRKHGEVIKNSEVVKKPEILNQDNLVKSYEVVKKRKTHKHTETIIKPVMINQTDATEVPQRSSKTQNLLIDKKMNNYFNDDDDFVLSTREKTKKKNILDDTFIEEDIDRGEDHDVHISHSIENEPKVEIKKPKPKVGARTKKKVKESADVQDENIAPDIVIVEKKTIKKTAIDKENALQTARKLSNLSTIIADVNANVEKKPEKVKGRGRRKKNVEG